MKRFDLGIIAALWVAVPLLAQTPVPESSAPVSNLHITSRAVLVDVVVTDHNGAPVTGLKQEAFSLTEQGKPQTIAFFEEHMAAQKSQPVELPALPLNVFTNFSPQGQPAAVNVLLLDSLNTDMADQSYVHSQAMKFLKSLKPGSRMAIFTMSLGLRFVQGFTDDPAVLVAALGSKKSNEVEVPALIKSRDDVNARTTLIGQMSASMAAGPGGTVPVAGQAMIDALNGFFARTDTAQVDDRAYRTLANLDQLASFLRGFPGRKNLIWFSESFPLTLFGISSAQFAGTDTRTEARFEGDLKRTVDLLTAARVAVYPVDARGVKGEGFYEAGNNLSPAIATPAQFVGVGSVHAGSITGENNQRNADQEAMRLLAEDSGGRAFVNTNNFSDVIAGVVSSSSDFYTVSYTPEDHTMDGLFRKVDVKVAGGRYNLAYRRGYFADDLEKLDAVHAATVPGAASADPLRLFMDLGMPQTEQILYKALIQPVSATKEAPSTPDSTTPAMGSRHMYSVDFAIDLKDLKLESTPDGLHSGTLNLSLIVYDRYGKIVSRKDHVVALKIKPDIYTIFQQTGVQLHAAIEVPKGQYWLRTGVYDQASRKVGTMEIPLGAVRPPEVAAN